MSKTTICKCGLAKCYHEGSHDIATRSQDGKPPICKGYEPREHNWWKKQEATRV